MAAMASATFVGCDKDNEGEDDINGNDDNGGKKENVIFENDFGKIVEDGNDIIYKYIEGQMGNAVLTIQSNVAETYTFEDGKCVSVVQVMEFVPESYAGTLYDITTTNWRYKYDAKPTLEGNIMTGDKTTISGLVGKTKEEIIALIKEILLDIFNPNGPQEKIIAMTKKGQVTTKGNIIYYQALMSDYGDFKDIDITYTKAFAFEGDKCTKVAEKFDIFFESDASKVYKSILADWENLCDEKPTMQEAHAGYDIICVITSKSGCQGKSKDEITNELKAAIADN